MYLFPLITSMYVSRTLGAENVGIYSYVNSIVTIFGMFCMLGIFNYGNREVAKQRENKLKLKEIFSAVYSLQIILSISVIIIYITVIFIFSMPYKSIFAIQVIYLFSVAFDVTWLFFGLEKFKITLVRNFIVKILTFLLIIFLVKSTNDLWIYVLIMCASSVVSQMYLLLLANKEVGFYFVSLKKIVPHIKGSCILFVPVLAYSVYRIMDKTMIGAMCEKSQLGYYENAERIVNIPIMIINALGTVMMPYMANLRLKSSNQFKNNIRFSMKLAMSIAIFSALGLVVIGDDLSIVLFGIEFTQSGRLTVLLSSTIIASAWANVIRTQYFIPTGKDLPYVISTISGAIINLVCNIVFIPKFQAVGACIGTILAEFSIVLVQTFWTKELETKKYIISSLALLFQAVIVMSIIYLIGKFISNLYIRILVQVSLSVLLYFVFNKTFILNEFLGIKAHHE